jgi:sterol desaturase/sphingolipid hydroxylase (fatty acid hydroxylase superfamily)
LLRDVYLALIALAIGVAPSQYVLLVSVSRALQSLQHANVRIHFGWLGERLLVSPRFHRTHHAVGIGHESKGRELGGCNFGVLLPVWDLLFRTANFAPDFHGTGVRDQFERTAPDGSVRPARDYGRGFWRQQWLGLMRLGESLARRPNRVGE